jgi:predicted small secreted protein
MKTIVMFISLLLAGCSCNTSPGTGDKVGQIAKVQKVGLMCLTTEILVTGKFGGGELTLTVPAGLIERAKEANESQEFVKVNYHTSFVESLCSNKTGNRFVDSIEAHPAGK